MKLYYIIANATRLILLKSVYVFFTAMTLTMTETKQHVDVSKLSRSRESDWPAVLFFIHIHLLSVYAVWLIFTEAKLLTILFRKCKCFFFIHVLRYIVKIVFICQLYFLTEAKTMVQVEI